MTRRITSDTLAARLKGRPGKRTTTWYLDLRHEDFAGLGRVTLRDPSHPKWPAEGRTARTRAEAQSWLTDDYVDFVRREIRASRRGSDERKTVAEACDSFVEKLERDLGPDHNTVTNWRSVFAAHVKPAFGPLPMNALTAERVRPFLENLTVMKHRRGRSYEAPASFNTRTNVRAALRALWRNAAGNNEPPFGKIHLVDGTRSRELREAAETGRILGDVVAYSRTDVARILGYAADYDQRVIAQRPNVAERVIPNTAAAVAFQIGLATRIEELMHMRWSHVFLDEGVAYVPGTKTLSAVRWTPIQEALRPWIQHLRELQGDPELNGFLFRVDPRTGGERRPPSKKTYGGRIARVLDCAGLKVEGKATHILRATHITWARAGGYPIDRLQEWVGHARKSRSITETVYTDPRVVAAELIPADSTYLGHLPTPAEAEALARRIASGEVQ